MSSERFSELDLRDLAAPRAVATADNAVGPQDVKDREISVPGFSSLTSEIDLMLQELGAYPRGVSGDAPFLVDRHIIPTEGGRGPQGKQPTIPARTTAQHGMTSAEVTRLVNTTAFMLGKQRQIWFATVGNRLFDCLTEGEARDLIERVQSRIAKLQKKMGLPQYRVTVLETIGGLHAHLLFVGTPKLVNRLKRAEAFEPYLDVRWAYNARGLSEGYLVKERTSQAEYALGHRLKGGRRKGSHHLPGGGDRVRLSKALRDDAIAAGYVEPWQQTNAKRSETRKAYRLRKLVPWKAARPVGQLSLFPELERDPARLRDYRGGLMPKSIAQELEFLRRRRGWSQQRLGELAGLAQPTLANAIAGLYGLSQPAVERIKQVLLATSAHRIAA